MDRRLRTVLSLSAGAMLAWGMMLGRTEAQPSPSTPTPNGGATPWVQAPPAASETPRLTANSNASPILTPTPGVTVPPSKPAPSAKPGVGMHPGVLGQVGSVEDTKAKMERERKRELAADRQEQAPDEQKTFEQNMQLWDRMTRDERQAMREAVGGRIRVEMDEAYKRSGLTLSDEQREMFDLRYRQERRKVEREVQEIARRERDRRLPVIDEQLRKEFGRASAANTAKAAANNPAAASTTSTPSPKPTPPPSPVPAPSKA